MASFDIDIPELKKRYGLNEEDLGTEIVGSQFIKIGEFFGEWEIAAPLLQVNADDVKACEPKPLLQRRKCLELFKKRAGFKATFRNFLEVLLQSHLGDAACKLCVLLKKGTNYSRFLYSYY